MQVMFTKVDWGKCDICLKRKTVRTVRVQAANEETEITSCNECEQELGRELLRLLENEGITE